MNEGYGFKPPAASASGGSSGTPTKVAAGTTHVVPANTQEIAFFDVQVDGDIRFDGDWVFLK